MAIIYKATCRANGKAYVGFTDKTLRRRRGAHECASKRELAGCRLFNRALRKHGKGNFEWEVLFEGLPGDALAAESYFIWYFRTFGPGGYNLSTGGESPTFGPDFSESIVRSNIRRRKNPIGPKRRGHGRVVTSETRQKIREKLTGRIATAESREKQSQALKGRPKTPATRARMSVAQAGRKHHLETREAARVLSPAGADNVLFLLSLGATQVNIAEWFGVSQPTVSRVKLHQAGY